MTTLNAERLEEVVESAVEDAMTSWQNKQDRHLDRLDAGASDSIDASNALHARVARMEEALAGHSNRMSSIETSQAEGKTRQEKILELLANQTKQFQKNLLYLGIFLAVVILFANFATF